MKFEDTLLLKKGTALMLGNEAIARGALEGGMGLAAAYPGTPSSEIVESLLKVRDRLGIYVEWSVNEKVAFEISYAAAISGVKSLVAMKHVGLNVAADPLMSSAYTGVNESFVIVTADDPSMWSSQNEQDNRLYGIHAYIPVFEPSDPGEAKELCKFAFEFSSRVKHPVILRTTTRLSHTRGPVTLGAIPKLTMRGKFTKKKEYVLTPSNARKDRKAMLLRWKRIMEEVNTIPFNRIEGEGKNLVITSGIAYTYVKEAITSGKVGDNWKILKLSTPYPVPRKLLLKALEDVEKVLIIEELEPVVEKEVKSVLYEEGINAETHGKDLIGLPYEMTHERVYNALRSLIDDEKTSPPVTSDKKEIPSIPPRPPTFCPGCPYRPLFYAIRKYITKRKLSYVAAGDIGCYALAHNPPYNLQDVIINMGGSIGTANGFAHVLNSTILAIIGDSTFFHTGIPPLVNAVWHKTPIITIILDNEITAMTGHQPSPTTRGAGISESYISLESVIKGLGINFVEIVDPFDVSQVENTLNAAIEYINRHKEPAVIIARRKCALSALRSLRKAGIKPPLFKVDLNKCVKCGTCYNAFACPAIYPDEDGRAHIDPSLCVGCGACTQVCPVNAIMPVVHSDTYKLQKGLIEKFWR